MSLTVSAEQFDAVILDMDGVVTDTAYLHELAWRHTFDRALADRGPRTRENHQPFSPDDYRHFVDGRSRYDGAAAFLASRGVVLPLGDPADSESAETVCGLGNRKDTCFTELIGHRGVGVFDGTITFVRACRLAGLRTAVVSASRNCAVVLAAGGVESLFDVRVDGLIAEELGLPGKPDPAVSRSSSWSSRRGSCAAPPKAESRADAGARPPPFPPRRCVEVRAIFHDREGSCAGSSRELS